jgi:BolA family transcriptional regulator, general stress-responsive regulator
MIERCLRQELAAERVDVVDESAQHAGHAGAKQGGHFAVTVVSPKFNGLSALQRHRLVYSALERLMKSDVHALSIRALTPTES